MAGYKETPRQKMIGMMYLVLTALLALNVSKDILNAFVIVNQGLKTSLANTSSKNELIYSNFQKAFMENPAKVKEYLDKAIQAQKFSKEMTDYVSELRTKIIAYTEFDVRDKNNDPKKKWAIADTIALANIEAKDNYDKPMEILIGSNESGANGEGLVLKNKLDQYKKDMLNLLSDKDKAIAEKNFPIKTNDSYSYTEEKTESWVANNFFHTVLAADVALLNKMLIDVKTVEGDVIARLFNYVDASSFKFDKIVAKVVAESNYILLGSEYKANIFLAAYDSKKSPDIYIGDTNTHVGELLDKTKFEDGMGVYTAGGAGVGEKKYTGWISITKPGETTPTLYPFSAAYNVGQPSATVSADKMNVFYIGVDNPVTISVPGVPDERVHASISAGNLAQKGGGKYIVTVSAGMTTSTISVNAEMGGKVTSMGSGTLFRVKRVPDPVATIGNVTSGMISKSVLAASGGIIPVMKDFDFELYFTITSFTLTMKVGTDLIEKNVTGNRLSDDMIKMIKKAGTGTKIWFENIKAVGPDRTTRTLSTISLKLSA